MTDLAEATQFIANEAVKYVHLNDNVMANYRNAFHNYLVQLNQNPNAVKPTPPELVVFDQGAALTIFVAWSDGLQKMVDSGAGKWSVPDFSPAISYVQAAELQVPSQPVPVTPSDPVGPSQGVNAPSGRPMYYTVAGDTSPDGAAWTDARGSFVKHVIQTPFGGESYWEKVA